MRTFMTVKRKGSFKLSIDKMWREEELKESCFPPRPTRRKMEGREGRGQHRLQRAATRLKTISADKFRVQGRVTDLSGNPLTDVELKVYTGVGTLAQTGRGITDASGRYDFTFTPGFSSATIVPQAATITAHKAGYFELNLNRQGNRLMAGVMPTKDNKSFAGVFLPGKTERIDFVMALAGQIEGLLVDHAGRPVPNRRLSLTGINLPPSSSVFQSTETDKNGRFHFSDVPGSPYKWWFEMWISGEGRSRVQLRTEPLQVDGGTLITVLLEYAAGSDAEPPSLECKGQRMELTTDHLIN